MSLKRSRVQKENLLKLKKEIVDFTADFKKRYQLFPWSKVNKLTKIEMRSSSPITTNSSEFTVMSLVKEINKTKTKIQNRLKPSYYNFLLKAYIKDSMNLEDKQVNSIYKEYEEQLNCLFKETKQDLIFCLEGLKQINKAFKKDEITESVLDNFVIESTHKTGLFRKIYHVSPNNLDKQVLHPRIPHNKLTEHDLEEGKTARVCFAPSIDCCLMALSQNLEGKEFYVHIPIDKTVYRDVSKHEVADAKVTKEKWVTCDVELRCIGKIRVISAIDKKYEFDLNDVNKSAVQTLGMGNKCWTYKWNWEWIETYTKESVSDDENQKILDDFKHYVKGCQTSDPIYKDIEPLDNPMIHKSEKNGDMLLLATTSIGKYKKEKINKVREELKKNVLYDGQEVEFHTCYLPGDVFIFIKLRDIVTESCNNSDRETILNKALDVLEDKGRTPKVSKKSKEDWINGKETDFGDALCIAGLGNEGLQSLCSDVNKIIKPLGGKVSPDNYGTIFLSIKESEEITMNHWYDYVSESGDYVDLRDFVLECYQAIENDVEDETFEEGTNLGILEELKPAKAKYRKMMKEIKKAKKNGNIDKAIKIAQELSDLSKDVYNKIDRMDSTVGSVIFGFFTSWTITFFRDLVLVLASPFTAGITSFIAWAKNTIEKWKKPVKHLVNSEGISKDDFNFYKNKALEQAECMMKASKRLVDTLKEEKKEIDKENKEAAKKDKAVEESANFKAAKYALYEACSKGEITIEEREELFKDLQDKFYVKEQTSEIAEKSDITNKQKFDEVRRVLYERCNAGEITIEERESLITKAHNMIFVNEGDNSNIDKAASELDEKEVTKNVDDAIKNSGKDIEANLDKALK